ncbi:MAG: 4-alpha-glucanotransferase [Acidimicrobiia bacterium]|nr:4-alpha-glucanotransferase [Acidimicrobiia bacterium]
MSSPYREPVARLARLAGVTTDWVDAWGGEQQVAEPDLLAVLEALLGVPLGTESDIEAAIRDGEADQPDISPVLVAWDGSLRPVPVPARVTEAAIVLESGDELRATVLDGEVTVPSVLPLGYHRLVVDGGEQASHVFAAPREAHPAPYGALGLISPIYSLRYGDADVGVGGLAELRGLADLCESVGISVVGTLPLLAAFPDEPSPYAPASRRAWNELFIDFSLIPEWEGALPVPAGDPRWVDYDATGHDIRSRLAAYSAFVSRTPRLREEVDRFLDQEPEMRRYAEFRARTDEHGQDWRAWQKGVVADPERVAYHETAQWLMSDQLSMLSTDLRRRGQFLYLDLPIGCHPDGYDIWDDPELFAPASLGAPPDTLFVGGQDWGLPASIPDRSRLDGHANFRKAIRQQLSVAGLLRIDHVMGIHRTWWVPRGAAPTQGAYVAQPTEELFAVICIESWRAEAGVVGENLGTVPPEINEGLADHRLLGMAMAQDGKTPPKATDLVALSSHDTPAFPAWWNGNDVDDLLDLGVFDEERAHDERWERGEAIAALEQRFGTEGPIATRDALMHWMAGTDAAVALLNLDDLLMEERRQNIPGTHMERPNWRVRHDVPLDTMASDEQFTSRLSSIARERTGGDG